MIRAVLAFIFLVFAGGKDSGIAQVAAAIKPYTSCAFHDGLQIVQLDPLPATPMTRQIHTPSGPKNITMLEGERIMFAYPSEDFYANVKAEQLAPKDYPTEKQELISELGTYTEGGKVLERNLAPLSGLEVKSLNRTKLEGGVLGIYLLFDDKQAIVTTIYFLNGEPGQRRFQTLPEYAKLRDQFLATYAGCVRLNLGSRVKP